MKPEELMIGDWFLWKGKPVQVASVSGVKYSFGHIDITLAHCNDKKLLETHDIKSIQPIPLTPEILEKNGFFRLGNQYNTWCMRGFNFSLDFIDGAFGYYEQGKPHNPTFVTKYVHELQHVLKLCGIDKTIEL